MVALPRRAFIALPALTCTKMMWLVWTMMLSLGSALHGCDSPQPPTINGNIATVIISGKTYKLEIAADNAVRMKGLGGRKEIAEDGGMIFAFTPSQVGEMGFVMRDCPIDIDIIYLDGSGRVLSFYEMKAEAPRGKDEGQAGDSDSQTIQDPERRAGDERYDRRLKQYPSRFPTTFAIELKAGSLKKLNVKEQDKVLFDIPGLKARAK